MFIPTTILLIALVLIAALFAQEAFGVKDADLSKSAAMPNGNTTTDSGSIDLGHDSTGSFLAKGEFLAELPALTTGELPDGQTFTADVIMSDNADLSSPTVVIDNLITQTGAGGAGAAAASQRCRLPSDVKRFFGLKVTGSATAGDASGKNMTFSFLA